MFCLQLKFICSEKATNFCEISTLRLSYVVPVKSKLEISQNFVAFSEYMNFNFGKTPSWSLSLNLYYCGHTISWRIMLDCFPVQCVCTYVQIEYKENAQY